MKKPTNDAISESTSVTAPNTSALAHSTGSLRGTAVSDERIIPVPYSPVTNSTPSTPMANSAKRTPPRLAPTASNAACRAGRIRSHCWLVKNPMTPPSNANAPMPSAMVIQLDRSVVSLSHSEVITRRSLTGSTASRETYFSGGTVVVMPHHRWWPGRRRRWCRRGIRWSRWSVS